MSVRVSTSACTLARQLGRGGRGARSFGLFAPAALEASKGDQRPWRVRTDAAILVITSDRVLAVTACLLLALVAAGCRAATTAPTRPLGDGIAMRDSPTPFTDVTVGDVSGVMPDDWRARPADPGGFEQGFVASPPATGLRARVTEGMAAVWIDGTRVGVPSDYYYLAAKHAAVDRLTDTTGCRGIRRDVFANHRPSYADGGVGSPGDFVAVGEGVCARTPEPTRFEYFVAAPGYGPMHRIGIPASGLYIVVAVVPDSPAADRVLNRLVYGTQFGSASLGDLIAAVKRARSL